MSKSTRISKVLHIVAAAMLAGLVFWFKAQWDDATIMHKVCIVAFGGLTLFIEQLSGELRYPPDASDSYLDSDYIGDDGVAYASNASQVNDVIDRHPGSVTSAGRA